MTINIVTPAHAGVTGLLSAALRFFLFLSLLSFSAASFAQLETLEAPTAHEASIEALPKVGDTIPELPASGMAPLESEQFSESKDLDSPAFSLREKGIVATPVTPAKAVPFPRYGRDVPSNAFLQRYGVQNNTWLDSRLRGNDGEETVGSDTVPDPTHHAQHSFHSAQANALARVKLNAPSSLDALFEGGRSANAMAAQMNASLSPLGNDSAGGIIDDLRIKRTIGTGEPTSGNEGFYYPYGIAAGPDGRIYVVDSMNNRVQIFNPDLSYFGTIGTGNGTDSNDGFNNPRGVTVAPDGRIYVTDLGNHRIQIFNPDGTYFKTIGTGKPVKGNEGFRSPWGVALDQNGRIYVADSGNYRIQIFNPDRTYLNTIGKGELTSQNDGFYFPIGVAVGPDGRIYVADENNNRIQIFNPDGTYLNTIGHSTSNNSVFNFPQSVSIDPKGRVYVADGGHHRVQIFNSDGTYFKTIGGRSRYLGGQHMFNHPHQIAISPDARMYVADTQNHRVEVFGSRDKAEKYLAQSLSEQARENKESPNPQQSARDRFRINWEADVRQ